MRGAVVIGHKAVLGLDQQVTLVVEMDGAEGVVAMAHGAARDLEGSAQKSLVKLGDVAINALLQKF
jgi:hypothetical protein